MKVNVIGTTLQRDIHSRGLAETDRAKADEYLAKAQMLKKAKDSEERINNLEEKVESIDSTLNDIKKLLEGMINGTS